MPLVMQMKNVMKIITPLIQEDEKIIAFLINRGLHRESLVLTDKKRILITDIPLIGKARLLEEFHVDEIESVDFFPSNGSIILYITSLEVKKSFILPFSHSHFPIKKEFRKFIKEIRALNQKARPLYLTENENIIETIQVKQGIFKLTEKALFLFKSVENKDVNWEIAENIPFSEIAEFDYYPETYKLLYLYVENVRSESRIFKIDATALFLNDHSAYGNPDLIIENMYESLSTNGKKLIPTYLYDNEEVITTCRASDRISGTLSPDVILRITSKRFIELKKEKQGRLEIKTEIMREEVTNVSITKHRGSGTGENKKSCYIFTVQIADNKEYEYVIEKEFQYTVDKLYALLQS